MPTSGEAKLYWRLLIDRSEGDLLHSGRELIEILWIGLHGMQDCLLLLNPAGTNEWLKTG